MGRGRPIAGVITGLAMVTSACSLLTSLDGLSTGDTLTPDARADAPTSGDGGASSLRDAADDAGPNLEPQGTFEMGTCNPWVGFQGSVTASNVGHGGGGSCRVCIAPNNPSSFTADDNGAPGPVIVGAQYAAEGWVRSDPSAPPPPGVVLALRIFTFKGGAFTEVASQGSPRARIDATWQRLETSLAATKPGTLNVFVAGDGAPGVCFLLDDVSIRRVN